MARLAAVLGALALAGAFVSSLAEGFREVHSSAPAQLVWIPIAASWLFLLVRSRRSAERLWLLPSTLFRASLGAGSAWIAITHLLNIWSSFGMEGGARRLIVSTIDAALYELGVVALGSLAAFAVSRSILRPVLIDTRPPVGARDITLRTRFIVATTGAAFATAGTLLSILVDFSGTPDATLAAFLGTALALVVFAAVIGWFVGDDSARGIEAVTSRMRELATAPDAPREMPVIAADEVGDLTLAAIELERRMLQVEAEFAARAERERVARELHDGVAKSVSALVLDASALAMQADPASRPRVERIERLARTLAEELRAIVAEFRAQTDSLSFEAMLRRVAGDHPGAALSLEGDLELVGRLARFETLRILDEALRNAERHANAEHVNARLAVDDARLRLEVEDDGKGMGTFSWKDLARNGHFGLVGMRERAELMDGDLTLEPGPAGGTRVVVEAPLRRKESES